MRISFLLLAFIALTNLAMGKGTSLKGKLTNADSAKFIYLFDHFGTHLIKADSAEVKKGKFNLKLSEGFVHGPYRLGFSEENSGEFLYHGTSLSFEGNGAELKTNLRVINDPEQVKFQAFRDECKRYDQTRWSLDSTYLQAQKTNLRQKNPEQFRVVMGQITNDWMALQETHKGYLHDLHSSTPKQSYLHDVSGFLMIDSNTTKLNYFGRNAFADERFWKGDIIDRKVDNYFTNFFNNEGDKALGLETATVLRMAEGQEKALVYEALISYIRKFNGEFARQLAKAYSTDFPESENAMATLSSFPHAPEIGEPAPNIELPSPSGDPIKLSSLRGQIVLIDFWASWCGPCRRENPNVVRLYNKYKDKGFTVYSVSLDHNKESWEKAIERDQLTWPNHVSDLKRWQSAPAQMYQVKGIPTTFLLDQNGKVIGKNLRGQQLEQKLAELFGE